MFIKTAYTNYAMILTYVHFQGWYMFLMNKKSRGTGFASVLSVCLSMALQSFCWTLAAF
jgi:hypothetical protein